MCSLAGSTFGTTILTTLRDGVAFVLQKNTLFSGTIRSNMQWGDAEATGDDHRCIENVQNLVVRGKPPEQLDAACSEQGGANFSGGQRQRLCIVAHCLKAERDHLRRRHERTGSRHIASSQRSLSNRLKRCHGSDRLASDLQR